MGGKMKQKPEGSASEHYLQQATRGLWGHKRREVREELEAHLHERVLAHRIAGLSETDAVERALSELGSPREVSVGMARLYTLPTMMGSGAALAVVCASVVALLPSGAAQALPGTPYFPTAECVEALDAGADGFLSGNCIHINGALWLDQSALRQVLEPQGVTFSKTSAPGSDEGILGLTFPTSKLVYVPLGSPDVYVMDDEGNHPVLPGYLSLWSLLRGASYQDGLELSVSGWDNPTVRFGDVSFQVGTKARPMMGVSFYESYLGEVFFADLKPTAGGNTYVIDLSQAAPHRPNLYKSAFQQTAITVPNAEPGVYGVAMRLDVGALRVPLTDDPWDDAVLLSIARPDAYGRFSFEFPEGPLRFVEAFTAHSEPGTAVLVRLSGANFNNGWYDIVAPERVVVP